MGAAGGSSQLWAAHGTGTALCSPSSDLRPELGGGESIHCSTVPPAEPPARSQPALCSAVPHPQGSRELSGVCSIARIFSLLAASHPSSAPSRVTLQPTHRFSVCVGHRGSAAAQRVVLPTGLCLVEGLSVEPQVLQV